VLGFDWYQATLTGEKDSESVAARLLHGSGGVTLRAGHGGYNRPKSLRGETDSGGSIAVYFGDDLDVHVVGTSSASPHVAEVLREYYPAHTVSRVDVALDFDQPGAFDRLWRAVHALATGREGRRVGTQTAGDWLDGLDGRTLYAGGAKSRLRIRVYEKGHEQRAKHPDQSFSLDWARVEWAVRPDSRSKLAAATATIEELAAWTPFGAAVLAEVYGLDMTARQLARTPSTDPEYWMLRQYSAVVSAWLALPELELRAAMVVAMQRARADVPA
jgi:hypothetical protein